ncbi:hypothetical protein ACJRO7_019677 [Eucalyptus globulus]|uniref:Uncharacterized protein n=1 Tax=Eucalyptus globulus TaxID=34317 RepID=A0ABD3KFS6_EUCGL
MIRFFCTCASQDCYDRFGDEDSLVVVEQAYICRLALLLQAEGALKQMNYIKGSWGTLTSSTPLKQGNSNSGMPDPREKTEPIVAFSRLPPMPPVLGPLVLLSLFETWNSHDGNED